MSDKKIEEKSDTKKVEIKNEVEVKNAETTKKDEVKNEDKKVNSKKEKSDDEEEYDDSDASDGDEKVIKPRIKLKKKPKTIAKKTKVTKKKTKKEEDEDEKPKNNRYIKVGRPKLNHSNFFLTINTNKICNGYSKVYMDWEDKLRLSIDQTFANPLNKLVTIMETNSDIKKVIEFSPAWFESVDMSFVTEIGPSTNTLHAHVAFHVRHRTKIHINLGFIKLSINNALGKDFYTNPNMSCMVSVVVTRLASETLEDYMMKNVDKL